MQVAANERLAEAIVLENSGFLATGLALRVYCVEIRLKVVFCRHLNLDELPRDFETHDLEKLLIYSGQFKEIRDSSRLIDPNYVSRRDNWDLIAALSKSRLSSLRYLPQTSFSAADLSDHLDALNDPQHGVWTWLSRLP